MGIGGGSVDAATGALLGVVAWAGAAGAAFGCGSLCGTAVPGGDFIGPCCCADKVLDSQSVAKHARTVIATRQKFFFAGLNKLPAITCSSSCFSLWSSVLSVPSVLKSLFIKPKKRFNTEGTENTESPCPFASRIYLCQLDAPQSLEFQARPGGCFPWSNIW